MKPLKDYLGEPRYCSHLLHSSNLVITIMTPEGGQREFPNLKVKLVFERKERPSHPETPHNRELDVTIWFEADDTVNFKIAGNQTEFTYEIPDGKKFKDVEVNGPIISTRK